MQIKNWRRVILETANYLHTFHLKIKNLLLVKNKRYLYCFIEKNVVMSVKTEHDKPYMG